MKQIEKDLIILSLIEALGKSLDSVIEEYERKKVSDFAKTFTLFNDKNKYNQSIEELSNEIYKRLKKKLPKEKK